MPFGQLIGKVIIRDRVIYGGVSQHFIEGDRCFRKTTVVHSHPVGIRDVAHILCENRVCSTFQRGGGRAIIHIPRIAQAEANPGLR